LNFLNILRRDRSERLIWENENLGEVVQVWEKEGRRELRFGNHIMQSVFSTVNAEYLVLPYTRFMLLGLLFCPNPKTVLHVGLGGGSIARWLHREFPLLQQTIIEINSGVVEAAQLFFDFPQDDRLRIFQGDATEIIPTLTEKFDLIFLDAYTDFDRPEGVKGLEFLKNLSGFINSTGWLVGNAWTMTGDFVEQCQIWKSTFAQVLQARANKKGNVILFGSQIQDLTEKKEFEKIAKILNKHHQLDFQRMLRELKEITIHI